MIKAMSLTASQVADQLRGEIIGDGTIRLTGFGPADSAKSGDLTFAETDEFFAAAEHSQASAILLAGAFAPSKKVLIRVQNARVAMAKALPLFFPQDESQQGIHLSAVIHPTAQVAPTAQIGPHCVVGERARIGARSALMCGNHIGRDCLIGDDVRLFPNVIVYADSQIGSRVAIHAGTVIGSDGYSYVLDAGRHLKVPQVGNVIIGDDVEIGANSAIDRGALGSTIISQGSKLDNLVHVAHNVVLGRHCIITGQVGFAGSTRLGDYCMVAAQSGIADHLKIGNQVVIGAKSGVMRDIPDGARVLGIPAMPDKQAKRQMIAAQHLPELIRRVRELEQRVRQLQS